MRTYISVAQLNAAISQNAVDPPISDDGGPKATDGVVDFPNCVYQRGTICTHKVNPGDLCVKECPRRPESMARYS